MKRYTVKRIVADSGRLAWGVRDNKLKRLVGVILFRSWARLMRDMLNEFHS